jgi:hypothetical protein
MGMIRLKGPVANFRNSHDDGGIAAVFRLYLLIQAHMWTDPPRKKFFAVFRSDRLLPYVRPVVRSHMNACQVALCKGLLTFRACRS